MILKNSTTRHQSKHSQTSKSGMATFSPRSCCHIRLFVLVMFLLSFVSGFAAKDNDTECVDAPTDTTSIRQRTHLCWSSAHHCGHLRQGRTPSGVLLAQRLRSRIQVVGRRLCAVRPLRTSHRDEGYGCSWQEFNRSLLG